MAERVNPSPEDYLLTEHGEEPPHATSLSGLVGEALAAEVVPDAAEAGELRAAGRLPEEAGRDPVDGDEGDGDPRLSAGDPDADCMENVFSGEEIVGSDNPLPDQNNVDDIGRAYGLTDEDNGALRTSEELLARRDQRRWELDPRSRDPER